jgi:hypothetical protein
VQQFVRMDNGDVTMVRETPVTPEALSPRDTLSHHGRFSSFSLYSFSSSSDSSTDEELIKLRMAALYHSGMD